MQKRVATLMSAAPCNLSALSVGIERWLGNCD